MCSTPSHYSASVVGFWIAFSWTSWGSHWTITSACCGSSGWQHNQLAYHSVVTCFNSLGWKQLIILFKVLSLPSTRSLMKMLKQYQPLNQAWGTLLLTGLQRACQNPLSPVFCPPLLLTYTDNASYFVYEYIMGYSVKNLAKVRINNIQSSSLMHLGSHFLIKDAWVGQAPFH